MFHIGKAKEFEGPVPSNLSAQMHRYQWDMDCILQQEAEGMNDSTR